MRKNGNVDRVGQQIIFYGPAGEPGASEKVVLDAEAESRNHYRTGNRPQTLRSPREIIYLIHYL